MTKKYTLDIFAVMKAAGNKDWGFWNRLSDEEKSQLSPLIIMRWMSGSLNDQTVCMNNTINKYVWKLQNDPELLWKLLVAGAITGRGNWLSQKTSKKTTLTSKLLSEKFGWSDREIKLNRKPTYEEALSYAEELGWQKDEIQKLKKELT